MPQLLVPPAEQSWDPEVEHLDPGEDELPDNQGRERKELLLEQVSLLTKVWDSSEETQEDEVWWVWAVAASPAT